MDESLGHKPVSYYIDFENVHNDGLDGIKQLEEGSKVVVFYSKKANTIAIDQVIDVFSSNADVEFVKIDNGTPNALDFQLTTMLIASLSPEREYVIVSADTGYDAVIKMAYRLGLPSITRKARISGKKPVKTTKASKTSSASNAAPDAEAASKQASEPSDQSAEMPGFDAVASCVNTVDADTDHAEPEDETIDVIVTSKAAPEQGDGHTEAVSEGEDSSRQASPRQPKGTKRRNLVNQALAEEGVVLKQQQLSSVMNALCNTHKKHDFYIQIIRTEGQQEGLELYRRVRDHYGKLAAIVR